jgi:hypothetical protein
MMDNKIFNVNGIGDDMLLATLKLKFMQGGKNTTAKAWAVTKKRGLILFWWYDRDDEKQYEGNEMFDVEPYRKYPFPSPMTAEQCLPFVKSWLEDDKREDIEMKDWDRNADHDGDNGLGWRVFSEDWGHVNGCHDAICAIKPVMLWYGK